MRVPKQPGKTSLNQLQDIDRISWNGLTPLPEKAPAVLTYEHDGFQFDFLWTPKPGSKRIFILFSGDALRERNDPPVFQRWSWEKIFPGHCLYVSDPSLYLKNSLGLAWYAGTSEFDPLSIISQKLKLITSQFSLGEEDIVSYGSSGGGFASIRLVTFLPKITAVAINPQTDITRYKPASVERFLDTCFSGLSRREAITEYPKRLSLIENADSLSGKKIIIAQNLVDKHHHKDHFMPLCAALNVPPDHNIDSPGLRKILFTNEGGHRKAENLETFQEILSVVESGL